jgi:VDE lipocalin domain
MDCDEMLKWVVFYYSGAAAAAGITYRGALICTPSGKLPDDEGAMLLIKAALERCGIETWEMFDVDNECCSDAPLSVPDYGLTDWLALSST